MTRDNGAVGIRVQVPVLGVVSGTRSLADIAAGKPAEPSADRPAVVTRDLDGPAPMAKPAPAVAVLPAPAVDPVAPKPKPADRVDPPKPPKPAASAGDDEARANRLLLLADNYLNAGLKSSAVSKLKEITRKYPNTQAAKTAEEKLTKLGVE